MNTHTFTTCPDCGEIAEVHDRFTLPSTDGPVEHVRTRCVRRHIFVLPTAYVERARDAAAAEHPVISSSP